MQQNTQSVLGCMGGVDGVEEVAGGEGKKLEGLGQGVW